MCGLPHFGQYFLVGFLRFKLPNISRRACQPVKVCFRLGSLQFDVAFRKPHLDEERFDPVAVVSLKNYLPVLGGSTARTKILELLSHAAQVLVFVAYSFDDGGGFPPFAAFAAYFNALLFFADFRTNTYVLW